MRVRFEEPLRKRLGKKMALKSDGKGDVARDDSQFDSLQLVGTQKVGAHPAPVSRRPGRVDSMSFQQKLVRDRTLPAGGTRERSSSIRGSFWLRLRRARSDAG
jgi:hypothetical protein